MRAHTYHSPWLTKYISWYPSVRAFFLWFLRQSSWVPRSLTSRAEAHLKQVSINSGFGGIHGAILTLAARCLRSGRWIDDVRPQTDTEMLDASVYPAGGSRFDWFIWAIVLNVHKAMARTVNSRWTFEGKNGWFARRWSRTWVLPANLQVIIFFRLCCITVLTYIIYLYYIFRAWNHPCPVSCYLGAKARGKVLTFRWYVLMFSSPFVVINWLSNSHNAYHRWRYRSIAWTLCRPRGRAQANCRFVGGTRLEGSCPNR